MIGCDYDRCIESYIITYYRINIMKVFFRYLAISVVVRLRNRRLLRRRKRREDMADRVCPLEVDDGEIGQSRTMTEVIERQAPIDFGIHQNATECRPRVGVRVFDIRQSDELF